MPTKMEFKNQVVLVNTCVIAGLILSYFRGAPALIVLLTGVFFLLMVNIIFFIRMQRAKKAQ